MKNRITHIITIIAMLLFALGIQGQDCFLKGVVLSDDKPVPKATITINNDSLTVKSDRKGKFTIAHIPYGMYQMKVIKEGYLSFTRLVNINKKELELSIELQNIEFTASQTTVSEQNTFDNRHLRQIEGTAIYAAKKSEVILPEAISANKATNNSRQVYAKVAGLNIWESDDAGLQLGIGGRGLSPNRTSNFNTRQNGYDISADALGYPESYYTPPVEAIERIEIIRGAASLQYGTQFGGVLNFVMKDGPENKPIEVTSRQTLGSFGLFNSFNSIGGTKGKWNYYTFFQYKQGNGWRPNSGFNSQTAYGSLKYKASERFSIGFEYTFMHYLAQQPGGLTDVLFEQNPRQSIRERNWFKVDWNVAALTMDYQLSDKTKLNTRTFGLLGERNALGFLGRISRIDPMTERDLIVGQFKNIGNETRLLHHYNILGKRAAILTGVRYYKGFTSNSQGFANDGAGPDFYYLNPDNPGKSAFTFPSSNFSAFAENIFRITPSFSITPGIRYEYISTASDGYFMEKATDLAGNVIYENKEEEAKSRKRALVLAGIGASYKPCRKMEIYANFSQNYRAINFNDLRIDNPNFRIDENIQDERGFNADIGFRGKLKNVLNYDLSLFYLYYNNRIGLLLKKDEELFNTYRYRTNIADSRNFGFESLIEADLIQLFSRKAKSALLVFTNFSFINARYINTDEPSILNKHVELVPPVNIKSGISFKTEKLKAAWQFTYVDEHFTDATNAERTSNAVNGIIPAYYLMDLSLSYTYRYFQLETGINNLLDEMYFSRRAAGYPGPGIIPANGRNFYVGLQVKI